MEYQVIKFSKSKAGLMFGIMTMIHLGQLVGGWNAAIRDGKASVPR